MCYKYGDVTGVWMGTGPVDEGLLAHARAHGLCAHNAAGFDEHIWSRFIGGEYKWYDTSQLARAAGMPGKLESLGLWLEGRGKDKAGAAILPKMYTLTWNGMDWVNRWIGPGSMKILVQYCHRDVQLMETVWDNVQAFDNNDEVARVIDHEVNSRGVKFDTELAATVADLSRQLIGESLESIRTLTDGALHEGTIRSIPKVTKWLTDRGVNVPNLRRSTVEAFLTDPTEFTDDNVLNLSPVVCDVLRLRNSCLRVTGSKLDRAVSACFNGRLYDMFWYHGAHTGRWSSRTVQVHNLSKGASKADIPSLLANLTLGTIREEAARIGVLPDDVLSALIRPCFLGPLNVADYAAIEARGLAWLAGDEEVLENFRNVRDPYKVLASRIYGVPYDEVTSSQRSIAKIPELGCGYGMGPGRLIDFAAVSGVELTKEQAEELVDAWREARPLIAGVTTGEWEGRRVREGGLWRDYIQAFKDAMAGNTRKVHRCVFTSYAGGVRVQLPSGRWLTYRKCRYEDRVPPWGGDPMPAIVYDGAIPNKVLTPGTLTENICQGMCRDVMVEAMKYVPVNLHVHDEIVWEGDDLFRGLGIMSVSPKWCEDMPIAAEGHSAPRYVKGAWPGYDHGTSRDERSRREAERHRDAVRPPTA